MIVSEKMQGRITIRPDKILGQTKPVILSSAKDIGSALKSKNLH